MYKNTILLLICLTVLSGCAGTPSANGRPRQATLITSEHNPVSLRLFASGREYSAAGRYTLAREQYLLAYAAAGDDPVLQDMLQQELKAVDLMIRTLR